MPSQETEALAPVERPRGHGWGDVTARTAMFRIADQLRGLGGYEGCAIEVVRGDDVVEFVALATDDPDTHREHDGASSLLSPLAPVLDRGVEVGVLTFVRAEDVAPDDLQRLLSYGVLLDVAATDDPARWHAEDLLVAQVHDDQGRLRAIVYYDAPRDGLRPSIAQLIELEQAILPCVHAILVQVEREEFAQRIRLASATRAVIRSASHHADLRELFSIVRTQFREPFRAQGLWIDTLDAFDRDLLRPPGTQDSPYIGPGLRVAVKSAMVRAWARQGVLIVENDRVWGDDEVDQHFRAELTAHVTQRGLCEIVLIPVGVGSDTLGLLAVARDADAVRWTDDESSAALDVAHDLGRAILNARAVESERAAVAELRQLGDYRRTLIDTVARELQNPLALVSGHLELLSGMDLPEDAVRSVVPMIRNTARLTTLAQDLSLLSRLADATTSASTATLDLAELTTDAVALVGPQAEHRDVTIDLSVTGRCDVLGHPLELMRCVGGLIDNAVKFSRRGGRVEVAVRGEGAGVTVTVRDHGIGISNSDQDLLFSEFFRSADPAALDRSGYGLGLSIVRQVTMRHDGKIEVESARGEGATFRLIFPRADPAALITTW